MKKYLYVLVVFVFCFLLYTSAHATGSTYYVDATGGNDANDGLFTSSPWRSLDKVNSTVFGPGDRIFLKAGERWAGTLHPQGSGSSASPIVLDMYGTGPKPLLEGQGATNVVMLYNQEYWDIGNLEITNTTPTQGTATRSGVEVIGQDFLASATTDNANPAVLHNIRLHDLYIHDINGHHPKINGEVSVGIKVIAKRSEDGSPSRVTKFDQVLIENNKIERVTRGGILVKSEWASRAQQGGSVVDPNVPWTPITNVIIRGNQVLHVSGDGIVTVVTTGALVEHNRVDGFNEAKVDYNAGIWSYNADYTTAQFNEVSGGKTIKDGMAFDFDNGTKGLLFQYNYSHDNEGGTVLICQNETNGSVSDGIFRYNISQNDHYQMITVCKFGNYSNMQFYNNVFYVGPGIANNMLVNQGGNGQASFKNNIFYNRGTGGYMAKSTWTYDSNLFFGNNSPSATVIPDSHMVKLDPQFLNPGSGTGINGLDGYQLRNTSPALNNGAVITGNGGRDFRGNPLYYLAPDRGGFEYQSNPAPAPTNIAMTKTPTSGSYIVNPARATDGVLNDSSLYAGLDQGLQWMKMDLGAVYNVSSVKLWHLLGGGRTYKDVIVQFSNTADFSNGVTTVFNNDTNNSAGQGIGTDAEYVETTAGKHVSFSPVLARYVRFWSNGSTVNGFNHYVEAEVYGN
ncbi:right-handed parallel beta-helix repeat-containing protein [Paenibacillus alba]|uniref:galactose-binding domain-containing protein n=1 Tax=Paenibacillus alba TaxID=1197127 RepID=UPI001563BA59|nr:right-handed parallel beta-helix repeat-containing protein [Paenibacillus alba]NQX67183.1 right-handed parallel beta-helix repeat-containing protein [Paenibacillus alba]